MDAKTILLFVGMIAALFVYWKKGGNQAASDLIATFKARDELQDKEAKRKDEQITKLTHEIGKLTGILEEKERRIKTLEQVDISRNPVMLQFMEKLTKSALDSEKFMASFVDLPNILGEINKSMHTLSQHIAKQAAQFDG